MINFLKILANKDLSLQIGSFTGIPMVINLDREANEGGC